MSQNEVETLENLIAGLSYEEKTVVCHALPDRILLNCLANRLKDRQNIINRINQISENTYGHNFTESELEEWKRFYTYYTLNGSRESAGIYAVYVNSETSATII